MYPWCSINSQFTRLCAQSSNTASPGVQISLCGAEEGDTPFYILRKTIRRHGSGCWNARETAIFDPPTLRHVPMEYSDLKFYCDVGVLHLQADHASREEVNAEGK